MIGFHEKVPFIKKKLDIVFLKFIIKVINIFFLPFDVTVEKEV